MKLGKWILGSIGVVGAFLVGEGIVTGAELTSIQSVVGLAMGGGGLTFGLILSILQAFPKTLVSEGYNKAVATYGQDKVDGFINKIDDIISIMETVNNKLDIVQADLNEQKDIRNNLLS